MLEFSVHWIGALAVHDAKGLSPRDVAAEMLQLVPMRKTGIGLVSGEPVEREGDVGSSALLEITKRTDDLAIRKFLHGVLLTLLDGLLLLGEYSTRSGVGGRTKILEAVRVEKILHVGSLIKEVAMGLEPTAANADVDVVVIGVACLEC